MRLHEGRDETILDPDLPIIDAHHHIWDRPVVKYMLDEWLADLNAGHNIIGSVYVEAAAFHRKDGPEWLRPIGEVEFANGIAAVADSGFYTNAKFCAAIVARADLMLGERLDEYLDHCVAAAPARFRGIRQNTLSYPDDRPFRTMPHIPQSTVMDSAEYPQSLAVLERRGYTYDAAVFDPSLPALAKMADRFPNLTIVLNHVGLPVGVFMTDDERAEVFKRWRLALRDLAKRPNVVCKVGGLGMEVFGLGLSLGEHPAPVSYEDLAKAWGPYVEAAVEAFGPERCLMESNFPPDARSGGYVPLWNAFKHILRDYSGDERRAMFAGNAARVYKLDIPGL